MTKNVGLLLSSLTPFRSPCYSADLDAISGKGLPTFSLYNFSRLSSICQCFFLVRSKENAPIWIPTLWLINLPRRGLLPQDCRVDSPWRQAVRGAGEINSVYWDVLHYPKKGGGVLEFELKKLHFVLDPRRWTFRSDTLCLVAEKHEERKRKEKRGWRLVT